jgi:hypothetical protein
MTPEQRRHFTVAANQAATLAMSAPERAMSDARLIDVGLIRNPDDLGAVANRQMVRKFVAGLPQGEQDALVDARGQPSAEGLARIRNAVLAKAYGDAGLLAPRGHRARGATLRCSLPAPPQDGPRPRDPSSGYSRPWRWRVRFR